ncbi:DUF742 domain-containing protein [Streptomyces sp. NPDC058683]|uniref:DUF742 domain-containing protein n=1 Tax=Streptomyces sp. NPDC058683 TaxID=3346597 RepID=UPI003662E6E4
MTGPSGRTPSSAGPEAATIRPYLATRGRAHPRHRWLRPDTLLTAGDGRAGPNLRDVEYQQMVKLCRQRHRSVAELAGTVHLPLTAARVLISDLIDASVLMVPVTVYTDSPAGNAPPTQLLEALRVGLARKWPDADVKAG